MIKYKRKIKNIYIIINNKDVWKKITTAKKDKIAVAAHGRPPQEKGSGI